MMRRRYTTEDLLRVVAFSNMGYGCRRIERFIGVPQGRVLDWTNGNSLPWDSWKEEDKNIHIEKCKAQAGWEHTPLSKLKMSVSKYGNNNPMWADKPTLNALRQRESRKRRV